MYRHHRPAFAAALVAVGLAWTASGSGTETCDPQNSSCPGPAYPVFDKGDEEDFCLLEVCVGPLQPLHAQISCRGDGVMVHCEAWPRTAEAGYAISYDWQASGSVHGASGWTDAADMSFSCTPGPYGQVHVTVSSPYGVMSEATTAADCSSSGPIQ